MPSGAAYADVSIVRRSLGVPSSRSEWTITVPARVSEWYSVRPSGESAIPLAWTTSPYSSVAVARAVDAPALAGHGGRVAVEHGEAERARVHAALRSRCRGRSSRGSRRRGTTSWSRRRATCTMSRPEQTTPPSACTAMPPTPRRFGTTVSILPRRLRPVHAATEHVAEVHAAARRRSSDLRPSRNRTRSLRTA